MGHYIVCYSSLIILVYNKIVSVLYCSVNIIYLNDLKLNLK